MKTKQNKKCKLLTEFRKIDKQIAEIERPASASDIREIPAKLDALALAAGVLRIRVD